MLQPRCEVEPGALLASSLQRALVQIVATAGRLPNDAELQQCADREFAELRTGAKWLSGCGSCGTGRAKGLDDTTSLLRRIRHGGEAESLDPVDPGARG